MFSLLANNGFIPLLYSHDDINDNNINNTDWHYRFWYERVYFFLSSAPGDTKRETDIKRTYGNHIIQIPTHVRRIL